MNTPPFPNLSKYVIIATTVKFFFEGINLTVMGTNVNLGHADPMAYGVIFGAIFGMHGYVHAQTYSQTQNGSGKVDNPDAN